MKVVYFYRSKQSGFSITRVFQTISKEVIKYADIKDVYMPSRYAMPWDLLRNGIYAFMNSNKKCINHITGEIHYLCFFLPKDRLVVTVHDIGYLYDLSGIKRKIWKFLYVKSLKRAPKVIFITEKTKEEVLKEISLHESQVEIIGDPVSNDFLHHPKSFSSLKPVILHVGTLPRKNLGRTVEALKGISCHLRIIGKISETLVERLRVNEIDYSNAVRITDEEMIKEFQNCDIINFPSLYEGFGVPIIEGQATGRVVVTSDLSPMREVAGGGAYLVDPYSIEGMHKAYRELIENPLLRQQIMNKGAVNVENYKAHSIAMRYREVYNELLQ
jgi:glycosyltransferase involved in cell wall biosynthesis